MISRFLMCPPDYFGVNYSINPWMVGNLGRVDIEKANKQWQKLLESLSKYAEIELLSPQPHLPDMVFTANAGLVRENAFIPSHFQHSERRPEEPHFKNWFLEKGYQINDLTSPVYFEGEGDALIHSENNQLWIGYGFRTDPQSSDRIQKLFPIRIVLLHLVDPRFYHLDTCFCLLPGGKVMYYPKAFSRDSLQSIEKYFSAQNRIEIDEEDAIHFSCNAIVVQNNLILNHASTGLMSKLQSLGFRVVLNPVSEFLKAGGGNKCLALSLSSN
ncbi:MAG: amidinotransferase [Nitrospina sp.]|jgi:N-dimethylarginine dimethylaminohydrolase|nr:amidinotransferase [Nitrospina sp.]